MLALFLQIDVYDLIKANSPIDPLTKQFDDTVRKMHFEEGKTYPEIAEELGVSLYLVKPVGAGKYLKEGREKNGVGKGNVKRRGKDWDELDRKMLSKVKEIIDVRLGKNGERPRRITNGALSTELGLHYQSFSKLKKCIEYSSGYILSELVKRYSTPDAYASAPNLGGSLYKKE